jgi:putative addiction module CopG family antidote
MTEIRVMLTEEQGVFVSDLVKSGYYSDVSEVMREALAKMKLEDEKLAALRAAIHEGYESGIFDGDAFESVYTELGWEPEA